MSTKCGKILWIDGVEGVGKSTLIDNLICKLKKQQPNLEVVVFKFPNDNIIPVRNFLLSRKNHTEDIFAYIANILATIEAEILPAVERGALVVCDRSILSSFVLQLDSSVSDISNILHILDRSDTIWKRACELSFYVVLSDNVSTIFERIHLRENNNIRDNLTFKEIEDQINNFHTVSYLMTTQVKWIMFIKGNGANAIRTILHDVVPKQKIWRRILDGISRM